MKQLFIHIQRKRRRGPGPKRAMPAHRLREVQGLCLVGLCCFGGLWFESGAAQGVKNAAAAIGILLVAGMAQLAARQNRKGEIGNDGT